jgi:poly-gamma-glutamate synthesis protein (capsule biosynthesis protein)
MITGVIADYQREVARALAAAGASAIIGHHPHLLKGIEFIDGVPVFYSLGNFAIEQPQAFDARIVESDSFRHLLSLNPGSSPESLYVLPPETRLTGVARLEVENGRIAGVRFHPCRAADDSSPVPLDPADPAFGEVHAYLERVTKMAGLNARFRVEDGALRVT